MGMSCRLKKCILLSLLIGILVLSSGCNLNDGTDEMNEALTVLLPSEIGFVWMYEGFAEYFHVMQVEAIEKTGGQYRYRISGDVADMSNGESDLNYRVDIEYLIEEGALIQIKSEEVMMDSIFDRLELIRYPLDQGSQWTQVQLDEDGQERTLECTIENVSSLGARTVYTVLYQDQDSEYYEKRDITTGIGVTRVEILWKTDEGNFPIGYTLYRSLGPDENT